MLFLSTETSFQSGCPFLAEFGTKLLPLLLILCGLSFSDERGRYPMRCTIFPVFIGSINGIGCNSFDLLSHEPLVQVDTFLQADTLIKRIERKMFDEGNSIYLYIVDFGSELDTPGFLSTDNGTDVVLVDTDYPVLDLPVLKQLLLLDQNLSYDGKSTLIIRYMAQF